MSISGSTITQASFDGSYSHSLRGGVAAGIIKLPDDTPVRVYSTPLVTFQNSQEAELTALNRLLSTLIGMGVREASVAGDNEQVIEAVLGRATFRRSRTSRTLLRQTRHLATRIPNLDLHWVPRRENKVADKASRQRVIDGATHRRWRVPGSRVLAAGLKAA